MYKENVMYWSDGMILSLIKDEILLFFHNMDGPEDIMLSEKSHSQS